MAVVAMNGNEVVGGLAAYELDKFEQDRREIYIYDLAVAESHRRRGVATGLISELRKIASERNVHSIFVQADTNISARVINVRFTPKSGHRGMQSPCPLC